MKKHFIFLLFVCYFWSPANSQISIDGTMTDWDGLPILSEPGVFPYAKTFLDGTALSYMLTLDETKAFNPAAWFTVNLYLDADYSASTGMKQWIYDASGIDYLSEGPNLSRFTGTPGTGGWSWAELGAVVTRAYSANARSAELSIPVSNFTGVPLGSVFGLVLPHYYSDYVSGDPNFMPDIDWNFSSRKLFVVKARTEVTLNTSGEFTSANAYYHSFMKDENINEYLDFQSAAWNTQNPLHWASWAVNLTTPGIYSFKMTSKNTSSGKAQLSLINMSTNAVVKIFDEVWYSANTDMTEDIFDDLDLSDVPAGKYMLKLTNPTTWDTFLKVGKITLTNKTETSIGQVNPMKDIRFEIKEKNLTVLTQNPVDISIYSAEGKLVSFVKATSSFSKELNSGFYLLKIESEGKHISKKVIIQ